MGIVSARLQQAQYHSGRTTPLPLIPNFRSPNFPAHFFFNLRGPPSSSSWPPLWKLLTHPSSPSQLQNLPTKPWLGRPLSQCLPAETAARKWEQLLLCPAAVISPARKFVDHVAIYTRSLQVLGGEPACYPHIRFSGRVLGSLSQHRLAVGAPLGM